MEVLVESVVKETVSGVCDAGVELLEALVNLEADVAGSGELVVEAVARNVSSSGSCDPSVTVAVVVMGKTSVAGNGISVRKSSDVLPMTEGDVVVRPKSTPSSLVYNETLSVVS